MTWKAKIVKTLKTKSPVLITGLPGIGHVGKIAVDYLIDMAKAKKVGEFKGNYPSSALVNESNILELPKIEIYNKQKPELLLIGGDIQPMTDKSCYEFCDAVIEFAKKMNCKEIITLGGVALKEEPENPKVYITGNEKKAIEQYSKFKNVSTDVFGNVNPVFGITGILPPLAKDSKIPSVALLAETLGNPYHIGLSGAQALLEVLKKKLKINININLKEESDDLLEELKKEKKKLMLSNQLGKKSKVSYIG